MTALSIAQLAKRSKREAAARTRAAIRLVTVERLAQLPASEKPIDQRIQNLLAFSRPGVMDPAEASMTYRRICSWCGRDMGAAPAGTQGDTHGICGPCEKKQNQLLDELKKETPKK